MSGKRNWGEERMDGHVPPPISDTNPPLNIGRPPSKVWKKKYKCKRLKGDHDFAPDKIEMWHFTHSKGYVAYAIWKCEGCGKPVQESYSPKMESMGPSWDRFSGTHEKLLAKSRYKLYEKRER